jgi:predicted RNA methylase
MLTRSAALRRNFIRKIRQVGFLRAVMHGSGKYIREFRNGRPNISDRFDIDHGIDTAGVISVGNLDISDSQLEQASRYQTLTPEVILSALRQLPIRHDEFTFIDIGSGKGRPLLLASCFPFHEIIGVEISENLSRIAESNIRKFKDASQRCFSIRVVCSEATEFELPQADLVIYLYNPFGKSVMQKFASKLEGSLRKSPRRIYILYHLPQYRQVWDELPVVRNVSDSASFVLYQSVC